MVSGSFISSRTPRKGGKNKTPLNCFVVGSGLILQRVRGLQYNRPPLSGSQDHDRQPDRVPVRGLKAQPGTGRRVQPGRIDRTTLAGVS